MKKAYIDELRQRMLKLQQDNSKIKMNGMGQYAQQMSDPNMWIEGDWFQRKGWNLNTNLLFRL